MTPRPFAVALLVACAAAVAGCGSTTVRHVTTTITRAASTPTTASTSSTPATTTASSTTTTSAAAAPQRSPLAGRSASAIVGDASAALRRSGDYAMQANLVQGGTRVMIALTTSGARNVDVTTTTGQTVTEVISLPGLTYLRANAPFWRAQGSTSRGARTRAAKLANRWLRVPAKGARSVTKSLGSLSPGTLARCLTEDHGRLTVAGHTTIGHTRAVLIRDAGDAPGATPSTLAVAAAGKPYPLRYTATGRTRPGGRVDVCNDGKGGDAQGTISLDQFGRIDPIQPPVGAEQAPGTAA